LALGRLNALWNDDLAAEQQTLSKLYALLDSLREQARARLREALLTSAGGTHQARSERDASVSRYADQIARWDAAEDGLCFGRLDFESGEHHHIGRAGLFDESGDFEPLLLDWRAPAARPFYLATAASPQGVLRRRQIRTRLRQVTAIDDEVLDLAAPHGRSSDGLTSEAALLSALNAGRTGRMRDIVETIQAEQDRIIRSDLRGVLVVQGGPGTGKTAVALHRAAYLLYTHREALTRQGVLILGPNETFLRYISQVLPGLGETSVLLSTLGDMFPGVTARRAEPLEVAAAKGGPDMVGVLEQAVRDRQIVPEEPMPIRLDDDTLLLRPATIERARERARRSGKPHNLARPVFLEEAIAELAQQWADKIGFDPYADDPLGGDDAPGGIYLSEHDIAEIRNDLRREPNVAAALDRFWPRLTPQQVLSGIYSELGGGDPEIDGWAPADVPLLDELAELLGEDETEANELAERLRRQQIAYAAGVLDISAGSVSTDIEVGEESEFLVATDLIDPSRLAERHTEQEFLTAAQRAAADRKWAFGHVIVDEAQELSPMAWRMLMRRAPNRSMTVVGDVAQTGDLAGVSAWADVFEPYVGGRWRVAELSVNYRTPAEVMDYAAALLRVEVPRSVRHTGVAPIETTGDLDAIVHSEQSRLDGGRLGVIGIQKGEADLDSQVAYLTVRQAKGLEFDTVIVVDPQAIIEASPRGRNDLYVALTRATQRLVIVNVTD
jgi:DNA helicase IV